MIFLLFIFFLILMISTYFLFEKDLMAPPFIFCSMYAVSIGLALTEYKNWSLNDYSIQAFSIYLGGALIFVFIGFLVNLLVNIVEKKDVAASQRLNTIYFNKYILLLIIFIDLLALFLLIRDVKGITGGGSLSQMMDTYRAMTGYSTDIQLPGYDQQLTKIVTVSAYICGYIFINNCIKNGYNKSYIPLIIPIIIYFIYSIYLSNRLNWLQLIAGLVVYYCLIRRVKYGYNDGSFKLVLQVLFVFIAVLIFFYLIRIMVGRRSSSDTGILNYLAMYVGGPVKLFDLYIRDPIRSEFLGKETFYGLIRNLRAFGLTNIPDYISHKEFRSINGIGLGNVYSAYRPWIADFGIKGMIFLQIIFSIFFNTIYFVMKKRTYYRHTFELILYGYIIVPVFMHPIDDQFYRMFFNAGFLIYILIFYAIYILLTIKIKLK